METESHRFVVDIPRSRGETTVDPSFVLDTAALFGRSAPVTLEIGSGVGDQIVAAAKRRPEEDFLALEVWRPGIAKLVSRAAKAEVTNLRVIEVDAAQAIRTMFPPQSIDEAWTFFPDPWRKARHHKRRLVNETFACDMAKILREGAIWRLATDWQDYAFPMRDAVESCALLANPYEGQRCHEEDPEPNRGGFGPRWEGRVMTRFEQRGQDAGRASFDLAMVKLPEEDGRDRT